MAAKISKWRRKSAYQWHGGAEMASKWRRKRESSNGEKYGGNGKIAKIKRKRKWRNGVKISACMAGENGEIYRHRRPYGSRKQAAKSWRKCNGGGEAARNQYRHRAMAALNANGAINDAAASMSK
jgi:hypothetical protein